jgi:3-hydroxyacyl-[acyl-carrier-protein] dehydratase
MRFQLIDRIEAVEPGKLLRAVKHLTLAEEYLAEHFPSFPVMPGVLQLQALAEAGAWLLRVSDDFQHSVWAIREVRGVKFGTFVAPGHTLKIAVELTKREGNEATLKARGEVDGQQSIAATIKLLGYNLSDGRPDWAERDRRLNDDLRLKYDWLIHGSASPADGSQARCKAETSG